MYKFQRLFDKALMHELHKIERQSVQIQSVLIAWETGATHNTQSTRGEITHIFQKKYKNSHISCVSNSLLDSRITFNHEMLITRTQK